MKRVLSTSAVAVLAVAVVSGAWVTVSVYGPGAADDTLFGTVVVATPASGVDPISAACPTTGGVSVTGSIHLASLGEEFVIVDVSAGGCQANASTLRIPRDQVQAVLST